MKFIKYLIIILTVYFAISLTTARVLVASVERNLNFFENYLSKNNITNVVIEKVTSDWRGLYPSIEIFISNKTVHKYIPVCNIFIIII